MSASGNASNLTQAVRDLLNSWNHTRAFWNDTKATDFEQTYIDPLPGHVDRTTKMMAEIDLLLRKIRSDCE